MTNLLWGVIGSVAGAVLVLLIQEILSFLKSRHGVLTGKWEQLIYNAEQEPVKKDTVKCRHIGDSLTGEIQRFYPKDQSFKKWRFQGKVRRNLFFGIFWSTDVKRNVTSYGTLQLYLENESLMKGFYVRLKVKSDEVRFSEELTPVRFEWKRIQ
jgi:hypothetical protein